MSLNLQVQTSGAWFYSCALPLIPSLSSNKQKFIPIKLFSLWVLLLTNFVFIYLKSVVTSKREEELENELSMHPTLKLFSRKKHCIMRVLLFFFFFLVQYIFRVWFLIHISHLQVCHGTVQVGKVKCFGVRQV